MDAPSPDTGLDCASVGCAPPPAPGEMCTAPCGCCTGPTDSGTPDAPTDAVADAPSDAPAGDAGGDVECGTMTCGPTEYCFIECTCCGIALDGSMPDPSADYTCMPIPSGCDPSNLCSCDLSVSCGVGSCLGTRTVECPCA